MTTDTVTSSLRVVVDRYTPSVDARHTVSAHRNVIETHLRTLGIASHLFETASWSLGTAVFGHSDVDYFAVMPAADHSPCALTTLAAALDMLPGTTTQIDRPAVRVTFADRTPAMEIVPAIATARHDEYDIPHPNQDFGWVTSAPQQHFAYVDHEGNLQWATGNSPKYDQLLEDAYTLRWEDYSDLPGPKGRFRWLAVPVVAIG